MSCTIGEALLLMRVAGRSREDCPYDRIYFPAPYEAWTAGWDEADRALREAPVGA